MVPFSPVGPISPFRGTRQNTLSPGDRVLMFETGHFGTLWQKLASNFGIIVDFVPGDWRHGVLPEAVEAKLRDDAGREIKAVMCVHNETSTAVTSRIAEVRQARFLPLYTSDEPVVWAARSHLHVGG